MPLAARHRDDPVPGLVPLSALMVSRETSAETMAALQQRSITEMRRRFELGHRGYVASLNGVPAAWGWVATRAAEIGELATTFRIPRDDRYLWNFVTLPSHRGLGIYPRLLDEIVRAESAEATRFWVAYAPENRASGAGIAKAGFVNVAELSFDRDRRPALHAILPGGAALAAHLLGLPESRERLAPCWKCIRAGKAADRACAEGNCCCDYQRPAAACAA